MSFIYRLFLKLLYPTSLCALLILAAAVFRKRERLSRVCLWAALAVLMICGNGWLVGSLTKNLEWRYRLPDPAPNADAILVLSGGLLDRVPPRQTIEVDDAGDRLLYAAHLFKQQKAGLVICTGGVEWTTGPRDHRTTGPQDHGTTGPRDHAGGERKRYPWNP